MDALRVVPAGAGAGGGGQVAGLFGEEAVLAGVAHQLGLGPQLQLAQQVGAVGLRRIAPA